jgi:ribonuclease HI
MKITRPELDWSRVAAIYTDGGVVLVNPSPIGGTWAFCYVGFDGERIYGTGGSLTPADVGLPWVSNNLTEHLAILHAIEQLPERWSGPVYSDSLNAIRTFRQPIPDKRPTWIPDAIWQRRCAALNAVGNLDFTLLGGHPTKAELAAGKRKDGKPVSTHNAWCDTRCGEEAAKMTQATEAAA